MKGGSADILVQGCFFDGRAGGGRAVNIGSSTGLRQAAPDLPDLPPFSKAMGSPGRW
jgi:hypothetical protein